MSTVGYGDIVPHTPAGRVVAAFIIFSGVILVSMFTATVSSIFVAKKLKEERGLQKITLKNHLVLCGWNATADQLLLEIFQQQPGQEVVLINQLPEEKIQEILLRYKDRNIHFVRGDFVNETILERANITKARTVIIIPDASTGLPARNDEKTILAAFTIKAMNPKGKLYVHILEPENEAYLKKAQVDDYLISDAFSGVLLGRMVTSPGVPQSVAQLFQPGSAHTFIREEIPRELQGKTFGEALQYYRKKGKLLIGIVTERKPVTLQTILSEDYTYLDEFIEKKFKQAGRTWKKGEQLDVQLNPPDDTKLESQQYFLILT